jgi:hypothetical protein
VTELFDSVRAAWQLLAAVAVIGAFIGLALVPLALIANESWKRRL